MLLPAHFLRRAVLASSLACAGAAAQAQAARHGTLGNWGGGNWGGSSFTVGRSTMYANGLVSNRVGDLTYFNNGLWTHVKVAFETAAQSVIRHETHAVLILQL
jgi:hypothetical protein